MIKQSSIKFAAGRIADATKKSKKFQEVLKSFCRKKEMHIHGITVPPEKLNSNTSPFYYNLIVCLLYTSDAADERSSVDLGGRRIIKKKNNKKNDRWRTQS